MTLQHVFPAGRVATKFELIGVYEGSDRGELLAAATTADTLWDLALEGPRDWIENEEFDDYHLITPGQKRTIDAFMTERTHFFSRTYKDHTLDRLIGMLSPLVQAEKLGLKPSPKLETSSLGFVQSALCGRVFSGVAQ